jgi:nucleoside-diphosphate-sugar epimerase
MQSIALVGAGKLGKYFVDVLSANKSIPFIVLTRPGSESSKSLPGGTKLVPVDLSNADSVTAAFRDNKIDVVISTLGIAGLPSQTLIADAAKAAGVKLFVLSEFGSSDLGATEGVLGIKETHAKYLASIGLPSVRIFVRILGLCCRLFF